MEAYLGPRDFITAHRAVRGSSTTVASAWSGSSSSSDLGCCKEIRDLVCEASEARGRYSPPSRLPFAAWKRRRLRP
jgi:hypothetical protein